MNPESLQAHKWEAIGRLSTGIAHDFNNILTSLKGYSELLLEGLPQGSPHRRYAERIHKAATRASVLTHQLLSLSRRQVFDPRPLDLNELVRDLLPVLQRLLGEDIRVDAALDPQLSPVLSDLAEMEQLVLTVAVHARETLPLGGSMRIATEMVSSPEGPRVRLKISHSGTTDEAARRALFEPFRSTQSGKGTNLFASLEMIRQSGGTIEMAGDGDGSHFEISLPPLSESEPRAQTADRKTGETLLVVEDDDAVLDFVQFILSEQGYQVLSARNAAKALEVADAHAGRIDLLIADVVLPGKNGSELAAELKRRRPNLRVLYMSGYPGDSIDRFGAVSGSGAYLQKPFSADGLTRKVRQTLDDQT